MTAVTSYRTPPSRSGDFSGRGSTTGSRPPRGSRTRRRNRAGGILAFLLALVVLGGVGWVVGFSPVLAAERVDVSGSHRLPASAVRHTAAVPLGRPLVRQDLAGIASRVGALPQVESAEVSRRWPHSIRISVVERRPLLGVPQPEGFVLIDAHGVAFESQLSLPRGVLQADVDPSNASLLAEVGRIVSALPPTLLRRVERLQATSPSAITAVLNNGVRVNWGTGADSALKSDIVLTLLKRKPTSIDVSSPHNPAIR